MTTTTDHSRSSQIPGFWANMISCKNVQKATYTKKHTIIVQYYSIFSYQARGHGLHFRANIRLTEMAYLMFPHLDPHFEFDTEFGKTH